MQVDVLRSTDKPEWLVCQAARGDYYEGYIGDTDYVELMKPVAYDEEVAKSIYAEQDMAGTISSEHPAVTEAKTKSFIEKQLSRGHYGPWEHPQITFSIKGVSRVTMAQITRHRHMTFDIQSQRYVDFAETEAIVPKSLIDEDHFSREDGSLDVSKETQEKWKQEYRLHTGQALEIYEDMVDDGIPKEDARFVLPLGTPVNMTFSGNARTFMHVFNLRQKASSQWEIRQLSNELAEELKEWAPYTFNWYEENKPHKIGP
jgi:thymidylate synthase (FAD)